MSAKKRMVCLEDILIEKIDLLVREKAYQKRNEFILEAVKEKLNRLDKSRMVLEYEKLDKYEEQQFAEIGMGLEIKEWPEY